MKISVLERILIAERLRKEATPIANKRPMDKSRGPWVVSNTKGRLLQTFLRTDPLQSEPFVLQGFFECPIDEENPVVAGLFETVGTLSKSLGWDNRCVNLSDAVRKMTSFQLEARYLLLPYSDLPRICGAELSEDEVDRLTLSRGYVAESEGILILVTDALAEGQAILSTSPGLVGHYMRSREFLSIMLCQADRSLILIGHDSVA